MSQNYAVRTGDIMLHMLQLHAYLLCTTATLLDITDEQVMSSGVWRKHAYQCHILCDSCRHQITSLQPCNEPCVTHASKLPGEIVTMCSRLTDMTVEHAGNQ